MITYQQLLNGYILKPEDKLDLNSHTYVVCVAISQSSYFLSTTGGNNAIIFNDLHKNGYEWAKQFGLVANGGFPFIDSLEHLTEFVKDIYREIEEQKSEFKAGTIITLCGITYKVYNGFNWFLGNCDAGYNDEIFEVLGISTKEKEKIARQFGAKTGFWEKYFPEFPTVDTLKEFVKYLKSYSLKKSQVIQEDYVSFETAKLLKNNGFKQPTNSEVFMALKELTKSIQINIPKINTKKIKL